MSLLSLKELSKSEFNQIIDDALIAKKKPNSYSKCLNNKHIGLLFEKPSTRTMVSFQVAISKLGGEYVMMRKGDLQLSRGETLLDTAQVLSKYLDALVIRTFSHAVLEDVNNNVDIPIINALSDTYHPCQALADIVTIKEEGFKFKNTILCYIGDGDNNVCHSLIWAATLSGIQLRIVAPKRYRPDPDIVEEAISEGAKIDISDDITEMCSGAHVFYTDSWVSMGLEFEKSKREKDLKHYQLNDSIIELGHKDSIVMHCLPAYKGKEISEDVFNGEHSRIMQQAENRLYAQMSLLKFLFEK